MGFAILALLSGIGIGLQRLGWGLPIAVSPFLHSLLMVGGFFGTLISLERAVALRRSWGYWAPALSGIGVPLLLFYPLPTPGWLLITLSSFVLIALYGAMYFEHRFFYYALMGLGACCWFVGNLFWWLAGFSPNAWAYTGVLFWMAFLLITIVAERLELNRLFRPSVGSVAWMVVGWSAMLVGLVLCSFVQRVGLVLFGSGVVLIAVWLVRFDTARYTMRQSGLPAFIGRALMVGYLWLGLAGLVALGVPQLSVGVWADALFHAFFLGFVFSMVFGHAPIIFPSVLGLAVPYRVRFYSHLVLLNGSLLLRMVGDGLGLHGLRQWGGLLNGLAILLFLFNTVTAALYARRAGGRR